jgi:hypothetical protein
MVNGKCVDELWIRVVKLFKVVRWNFAQMREVYMRYYGKIVYSEC